MAALTRQAGSGRLFSVHQHGRRPVPLVDRVSLGGSPPPPPPPPPPPQVSPPELYHQVAVKILQRGDAPAGIQMC